jgi:hypothetical protein
LAQASRCFAEAAPLLLQLVELAVPLARGEAQPAEVEQHRHVAHVGVGEARLLLAHGQQLGVARPRAHRPIPGQREEALDREGPLLVVPAVEERDAQPLVLGARPTLDHTLELPHQRRHEVHRQAHAAVLLEQAGHVEVAARAVQAHPRQERPPRARVGVLGLVHVEQEDDVRSARHADLSELPD